MRTSLDLERNLGSLLNNSIAAATYGDAQVARKLLDEAVKMPGAANEDAQRGFKFADGLIRWRQGDKSAADALPVPTDASDTGATFLHGIVQLAEGHAEAAAARFKQILDRKQLTINPLKPIAALYYGRALVRMGKVDEGRQATSSSSRTGRRPTRICRCSSTRKKNTSASRPPTRQPCRSRNRPANRRAEPSLRVSYRNTSVLVPVGNAGMRRISPFHVWAANGPIRFTCSSVNWVRWQAKAR